VVGGSNAGNTTYVYANGERIARKDPDNSVHYYHSDHLGSTSLITNSTGGVEENTKYYPFGGVRSGGTNTKYLYTGKEKDFETGLYYYGARYYNPNIMHFTQPDNVIPDIYDPQSLNRYSYVKNNPLKYTDPTGHFAILPFIAFVAVAAAIGYLVGSIVGVLGYMYDHKTLDVLNNPEAQSQSMATGTEFAVVLGASAAIEATTACLSLAAIGGVATEQAAKSESTNLGQQIAQAFRAVLRDNSGKLRFGIPEGGFPVVSRFASRKYVESGEFLTSTNQLTEGGDYIFAENMQGIIKIGAKGMEGGSHADLFGGRNVLTAGHIIVENGKYNIYCRTGHYEVSGASLSYAKEYLINLGVSASDIIIHQSWRDYPGK
jgi:RHS repeat-associated protein